MIRFIPFIFVLLWSTGFIGAKYGLPYAEPFTMLMWRMLIVVPLFFCFVVILKRPPISFKDAAIQGLVGLLIHGFYLGGVFAAISIGMPAGLSALFVSLNPLLIAIFSGMFLHVVQLRNRAAFRIWKMSMPADTGTLTNYNYRTSRNFIFPAKTFGKQSN